MPAKLYVVHGSHPCAAVARAMDMKGFAYEVVKLLPPLHAALQRMRFGARTVPGLVLESGEKISGSRADLQALPEYLDRVDAWIADGVIGGDAVNAADLQIASSSRLMLTFGDMQT